MEPGDQRSVSGFKSRLIAPTEQASICRGALASRGTSGLRIHRATLGNSRFDRQRDRLASALLLLVPSERAKRRRIRLLARESEHGAQDPEPPLCMEGGAPPAGRGGSSEG